MSFSAEEIFRTYQKPETGSVHMQLFAQPVSVWRYLERTIIGEQLALQLSNNNNVALEAASYNRRQKELWKILLQVRDAVLKSIEPQRAAGVIKLALEARVKLWFDKKTEEGKRMLSFISEFGSIAEAERFFAQWFIVSQCKLEKDQGALEQTMLPFVAATVEHAIGQKCLRCWQWHDTTTAAEDFICLRCAEVVVS